MKENEMESYISELFYPKPGQSQRQSRRHMRLTPMMIPIMEIIYRASKSAKDLGMEFNGLIFYDFQRFFNRMPFSSHGIRDNLEKLIMYGYITKTIDGKSVKYNLIESDKIKCNRGNCILFDKERKLPNLFAFTCPRYPFCSLKEEDCGIGHYLELFSQLLQVSQLPKNVCHNKIDAFEYILKAVDIIK